MRRIVSIVLILGSAFTLGCGDLVGDIKQSSTSPSLDGMKIQIESGDDQSAEVGMPLAKPLVIQVINGEGEPLPNQTVEFSVVEGEANPLSEPSTSTDEEGKARAELKFGSVTGKVKVRAEIVPNTLQDPSRRVEFLLSAIQAREARLFLMDGDDQVGVVRGGVPKSLQVKAQDRDGNPVAGTEVGFSILKGDAEVDTVGITNEEGIAASTVLMGGVPGEVIVEAKWMYDGAERKVQFRLRSQSVVLRLKSGLTNQTACAGEGKTYPTLVFEALSEGNLPVVGQWVKMQVTNGSIDSASFETPVEKRTDLNGKVSFKVKAGNVQRGSKFYDDFVTVVLSLPGVSGFDPKSYTLTVTENIWIQSTVPPIWYAKPNYGAWFLSDVRSEVKKACNLKASNIKVTLESRSKLGCPSAASTFGSFFVESTEYSNSDGIATNSFDVPFFSYRGNLSNELRLSVPNGNRMTFIVANATCQ